VIGLRVLDLGFARQPLGHRGHRRAVVDGQHRELTDPAGATTARRGRGQFHHRRLGRAVGAALELDQHFAGHVIEVLAQRLQQGQRMRPVGDGWHRRRKRRRRLGVRPGRAEPGGGDQADHQRRQKSRQGWRHGGS
jgi:hypothetical protein